MEPKYKNSHVQSAARTLQILDLMGEEKRALSLTELSVLLEWPKSTVHGFLATLRDYDYISQSEDDGKYSLGIRLFELGNVLQASWDINDVARPKMVQLNARFGETVHLATEDKGEVLYLEKIDSNHLLRIVSQVGSRLPMHCTGVGKTLLAFRSNREVAQIIQRHPMQSFTSKTITDSAVLERELNEIRERGYAYDNGEIMDSLRCVAAPIYNSNGNVSYALSISGLSNNMNDDRIGRIVKELLNACNTISKEIGYQV